MKLRIRIFELTTKEQIDLYNEKYDDLWESKYNKLVEKENLICKELETNKDSIISICNTLYPQYEGYCIQIYDIKNKKVVYGGNFDNTFEEYINDYII
jgi:hypothetical protein